MVNFRNKFRVLLRSSFIGSSFLLVGCGGSHTEQAGPPEPPPPITLTMVTDPVLSTDTLDPFQPWILSVNSSVQLHVINPKTSNYVDNLVVWSVGPIKNTNDPTGMIDQSGKYTAPATPSYIGISARADSISPALRGTGRIEIVALPTISQLSIINLPSQAGQITSLMPIFENGNGQLLNGKNVISDNIVSGKPIAITLNADTTVSLLVTNKAGDFVYKNLQIIVQ